MEKFIWLVEQESSDPAKDAEVKEWLEKVHVPGMLGVSEIVGATLYENRGPMLDTLDAVGSVYRQNPGPSPRSKGWSEGQGKYIAVYDIETEDLKQTWEGIWRWVQDMHRQHKDWRHPLKKVVSRSVWEQVGPSSRKPEPKGRKDRMEKFIWLVEQRF